MTVRPGPPGSLLNLDASRVPSTPVDAATLVLLRDDPNGLQVFCVERSHKSRFMGGAVVFPGGKVDEADRDAAWQPLLRQSHARLSALAGTDELRRALAVAACRESLEEAAILPVTGALSHADAVSLRETLVRGPGALRDALITRGISIDLEALVPFARWITPAAEARRFDARFFMMRTPPGQDGAHDERETVASFWATPQDVLERWHARFIQLAPPTHRTLEWLRAHATVDAALEAAQHTRLEPICPVLVNYDGTMALVLPGDRDHPQADPIIAGPSRYVLRDEQWRPESVK